MNFTDQEFPPQQSSLYTSESQLTSDYLKQWVNITWKQIQINPNTLFQSQNELKQGKIGNCYLISVLLTLKDFHIKNLFKLIEKNKITINFYRQGNIFPVTIDTWLPYYEDQPAFIQGSLWASLIEKAYAKFYGSYINLEGGSPSLTYYDLLGAEYETYLISEISDQIIPFFERNLEAKNLLCAYTFQTSEQFKDHSFAVINTQNAKINMKNPSGTNSSFSEDELKKIFEGVCLAIYRNNLQSICRQIIFDKLVIKLEIKKKSIIQLGVHQLDMNTHSENFSFVRMVLCRQNLSSHTYLEGKFKQSRDVFIGANLDPGIYAVLIEIISPESGRNDIYFSFQSDFSNKIIKQQENDDAFYRILKEAIGTNLKQENIKSYDSQKIPIFKCFGTQLGYLYFYYKNDSFKHMLYEMIIFKNLNGYQRITKPSDLLHLIEEQEKVLSEKQNSSAVKETQVLGRGFEIMVKPQMSEIILFSQLPFEVKECKYSFKSKTDIFEADQQIIPRPNYQNQLNQFSEQFNFNLTDDQKKLLKITTSLLLSCFVLFILDSKCAMIDTVISIIVSKFVINSNIPKLQLTLAKLYVMFLIFAIPSTIFKIQELPNVHSPLQYFQSIFLIINIVLEIILLFFIVKDHKIPKRIEFMKLLRK